MFSSILFRIFVIHLLRVQQSLTFTFNLYSHSCVVSIRERFRGTENFQRWINFPTVLIRIIKKKRRCSRKLKSGGSLRPLFDLDTCSFFLTFCFFFFFFLLNIHKILFNLHKIYNVHYRPERDQDDSYTHLLGACNTLEHYII